MENIADDVKLYGESDVKSRREGVLQGMLCRHRLLPIAISLLSVALLGSQCRHDDKYPSKSAGVDTAMDTSKKVTVALLPLGNININLLREIAPRVEKELPGIACLVALPAHGKGSEPERSDEQVKRADQSLHFEPIDIEPAYVPARMQYLADTILNKLPLLPNCERVVGILDVDIFSGRLNFVFGIANLPGARALISIFRLMPRSGNDKLLKERIVKEIVHELGHTFGLHHCPNPRCVMHFSNSLADTDYKGASLCDGCRNHFVQQVNWLLHH